MTERTHGKIATYNDGCRCADCRSVSARTRRRQRRDAARRIKADPSLAPHGSASTYRNWICRCAPCTAAQRVERVDRYRRERVDA